MAEIATPKDKRAGAPDDDVAKNPTRPPALPKEIGGPPGPEPTRYGDWEYKGRCTDF